MEGKNIMFPLFFFFSYLLSLEVRSPCPRKEKKNKNKTTKLCCKERFGEAEETVWHVFWESPAARDV